MAATSSTAAPKARPATPSSINGNAAAETYHIYTRAAWDALAGNDGASLARRTGDRHHPQRHGLRQRHRRTERDRGNPHQRRRSRRGRRRRRAGDTFEVIGDFSATSLRLNTITIDGDAGDDTIDISALTSAHRIVFKSNGGNDTIIGALQAEDVIELPAGRGSLDLPPGREPGRHQDHLERDPFGHLHGRRAAAVPDR